MLYLGKINPRNPQYARFIKHDLYKQIGWHTYTDHVVYKVAYWLSGAEPYRPFVLSQHDGIITSTHPGHTRSLSAYLLRKPFLVLLNTNTSPDTSLVTDPVLQRESDWVELINFQPRPLGFERELREARPYRAEARRRIELLWRDHLKPPRG